MNLVYMGSGAFAVPTLARLFEAGYPIRAVITQPDKPVGRGQRVQPPPAGRKAYELHLPIHQPASLRDEHARALFEALDPDLIVVVAYGKILPGWLLRLPRYGTINLHGSLLPRYRGAAPIHWAIANGETETGVCTMLVDEGLDTGPVFLCERTTIGPDESVTELSERLAILGAELMLRTIPGVLDGSLKPTPQDHTAATSAPMLRKHHGYLDWNLPARDIHNRVRAFNPWPGTITRFRQTVCKVLQTAMIAGGGLGLEPGGLRVEGRRLLVQCGADTGLELVRLQPENRKPVSGLEFANGARLRAGEKFERVTDN